MALHSINPTQTKSWAKLNTHFEAIKDAHMKTLFAENPGRVDQFTIQWEDFYVDFSKNRINQETMTLFKALAEELKLNDAISKYFEGDIINHTEGRAVLHTALRAPKDANVLVDGANVIPEIHEVKSLIKNFSEAVINGIHQQSVHRCSQYRNWRIGFRACNGCRFVGFLWQSSYASFCE
jgi:glucose-6-phosphate isomerase